MNIETALAEIEANMVSIPGGTYLMGSSSSEPERGDWEGPQQRLTIPAFLMGKTEVTFAQWDACVADGGCRHKPEDRGWGRGNRPVINVSYDDITQQFIPWLNRKTGKTYRLPSEGEWEYAARAGTTTRFNTGDCITTDQANFGGTSPAQGCPKGEFRQKTLPVGSFEPNNFGLHDMHGNVWEWCEDAWVDTLEGIPLDGSPRLDGDPRLHVLRGGSWIDIGRCLRSAYRNIYGRGYRYGSSGFRLARGEA